MANYDKLISDIKAVIKPNGAQSITGQVLQDAMLEMVSQLGKNYAFGGVATPSTNPGTPTTNTFYIATEAGTYANMGGVEVKGTEFAVITWNGSVWSKHTTFDVLSIPESEGADPNELMSIVVDGDKLKQVKLASLISYKEDEVAYGVEWDVTVSSPAMTRIGNMSLHRSLPIQKKIKGCLLSDNGDVVEYLPEDDWTGATLDGSAGQVMVEIPMHYRKFETIGNIRRCWISEYPVSGYHKVPKMYISAYEASLKRSYGMLCSVVNNDADYRGGNNQSDWDGTHRSLLGRPITLSSIDSFRTRARRRKPSTTEWNILDYHSWKAVVWLYCVEYANRNSQLPIDSTKDANGCAQGGLGAGVTTFNLTDWTAFNSNNPFVPCGYTNSIGNRTGKIDYDVLGEDGSVITTVEVNRYRGIENIFGHINQDVDGILVVRDSAGNPAKVCVANNPALYNNTAEGYSIKGDAASEVAYIQQILFGEDGDLVPSVTRGGATLYWCDYATVPVADKEVGVYKMMAGGASHSTTQAGLFCTNIRISPKAGDTSIGTRICFIPENK